jgi:hypothetical protein
VEDFIHASDRQGAIGENRPRPRAS